MLISFYLQIIYDYVNNNFVQIHARIGINIRMATWKILC